jgi:dTDP-4-dehydrorhamnose reductase
MKSSKVDKVLVLGATGMLGHVVARTLIRSGYKNIIATVRSEEHLNQLPNDIRPFAVSGVDAVKMDSIEQVLSTSRPVAIVNCIGVIKQRCNSIENDALVSINGVFPHHLSRLSSRIGAKLVHISTDCVFSGKTGNYIETDLCDARDIYGKAKYLGEIVSEGHVTIRTSMIGHELSGKLSLLEWFLSQQGTVPGYTRAVFSGLTTNEIARVLVRHVIFNRNLCGLYHLSGKPIAKYDLLRLVANQYRKSIDITPDKSLIIDRSLNSKLFRESVGYNPPGWETLIEEMHDDYNKHK